MASSDKLSPLVLSSNSMTTYNDWSAWKRALLYYLDAKEIKDSGRKKAVLMHKGGREIQEIFAAIEQADPKATAPGDPFQFAIEQLEKHFKPTTNRCYERFLFRRIKQGNDSIEQFVVKLRKQAANCKFASIEEALCDQIIDGTSNPQFRQKILEQRLEKLSAIVELGKLMEAVTVQVKDMAGSGNYVSSSSADSVARLASSSRDNRVEDDNWRRNNALFSMR